jgi:hypothetical protein
MVKKFISEMRELISWIPVGLWLMEDIHLNVSSKSDVP